MVKKLELVLKIGKIEDDNKIDQAYLLTNLDMPIFELVVTTYLDTCDYDRVINFLKERYSTHDKFLNRL